MLEMVQHLAVEGKSDCMGLERDPLQGDLQQAIPIGSLAEGEGFLDRPGADHRTEEVLRIAILQGCKVDRPLREGDRSREARGGVAPRRLSICQCAP